MKKWHWLFLSMLLIFLDQLSKYVIIISLVPYKPVPVFPMFNLTLAFNSGAAFGFLHNAGDWHQWFFTVFSLTMTLFLLVWLWRTPAQAKGQLAGISLILGGAVGNLIDRGLQGYVIDFIDIYYRQYHFATFNLADSAICVGAALIIFYQIKENKKCSCHA